ncbi:unnamed protein product, partial [Brenthis ino]
MDYFCYWCKSQRTLEGVTVIITGCNTGIGKETCLDLFKRGANVIMACRNIEKATEARKDIINQATIEDQEKNINILINNAGVMMCPKGTTEDGFEIHMGTNHIGHAMLTLLLLPRIIKSAPSKIINISSVAHFISNLDLDDINSEKCEYYAAKVYSNSKIANILFARAIHLKLRDYSIENVNTYSLHPGLVRTELSRHFSDTMIPGGTWFFNNIIGLFIKSARCGAQTTIYCAVDEACDKESGHYYDDCHIAQPSPQCRDDETALNFFDLTVKMLKLDNFNSFGELDPSPSLFS